MSDCLQGLPLEIDYLIRRIEKVYNVHVAKLRLGAGT
jgi:hypothetical protein